MKAYVYHGPGEAGWEQAPDPAVLRPTDAVVRIDTTTICGTDLHILAGDVPEVADGRVLGHEGVGTVVETGAAVSTLTAGDRVLVSCISSCGVCVSCRGGLPSHCLDAEGAPGMGWLLGHLIDGTQAEYVRVPFAEHSLHRLPEGVTDAQALALSDILPTGFEIGIEAGAVRPGDVVAVVGAGPVGLASVMTARLHGPSRIVAIDLDDHRLARARDFGATDTVNSGHDGWTDRVRELTDGLGVDVAIEAVGVPQTFTACLDLVRDGGHVANVGVHGRSVELPLQELWIRNLTLAMGLVNATSQAMLLKLVAQHRIDAERFVTHRFGLGEIDRAYDVFGHAAEHDALKVLLAR